MNSLDDSIILYENGLTIKEISERLNTSYETIRKFLKGKVKWRKKYITDLTPDEVVDIINRFDNKESLKKISLLHKISEPAISRLLKAHNRNPVSLSRKYDVLRQTSINSIQQQFIVGTLLGDGCLAKHTTNGNYKLSFGHQIKHEQYFHWKIAIMDPFINSWSKSTTKNSVMLQTSTICHKDLNKFANMFYDSSRIKHVPDNLDMYLTPLSLATWVMDDGNLNKVNMRIASMSFSEEENYKLTDYLKKCFNLNSKVMGFKYRDKQYWQITLNKRNTEMLSDIIRPHVVECMRYKILKPSTTTCQNSETSECDIV